MLATQCVHEKNARKFRDSLYINNLLLKINAKLGGVVSSLGQFASMPAFLTERSIMTIGIDFTHPSPGDRLSTSICSCVGSIDMAQSIWVSSVRINKGNAQVELITGLDEMIETLLTAYLKANQFLPAKVLIYRDGISDAQFEKVLYVEVKAIDKTFQQVAEKLNIQNYKPKLTLVVVQKSHRTRFIPEHREEGVGKAQNIPPGTVVDTDVIHMTDFDFYLASHEGLQVKII